MKLIDGVMKSKEDVCKEHKRIVYKHAHHLKGAVSFDDLVSEGFIGLLQAYEKYDSSKNIKFSTYGGHLAYLSMLSSIRNSQPGAYFPYQVRDLAIKINKRQLKNESVETIMKMWGNSRNTVIGALTYLQSSAALSIHEPQRGTDEGTLEEAIPSSYDDTWIYISEFRQRLTKRENFVLDHLIMDKNCREISEKVKLTTSAIQANVRNMRRKYREYAEGI